MSFISASRHDTENTCIDIHTDGSVLALASGTLCQVYTAPYSSALGCCINESDNSSYEAGPKMGPALDQ
jgi:hypothetical protein